MIPIYYKGIKTTEVLTYSEIENRKLLMVEGGDELEHITFGEEEAKTALTKQAAELFSEKYVFADQAILKEKAALAPVYERKYEKAMAGEFSEKENQAIIKNHETQMQAKDYYMELLDLAYQGVTAMTDSGKLDESALALEKFAGFDETATAEDIKAVIAV